MIERFYVEESRIVDRLTGEHGVMWSSDTDAKECCDCMNAEGERWMQWFKSQQGALGRHSKSCANLQRSGVGNATNHADRVNQDVA